MKVQLKYLSLCLFSLAATGCSQHVIKTNSNQAVTLEQKAVTGLNAIFETPSYDFQGQLRVQAKQQHSTSKTVTTQSAELDPALKKQLDQHLKQQKIRLSTQEKQNLYAAMAKEQRSASDVLGVAGKSNPFDFMLNVLNDTQFDYDGSVHYRQKIAALNVAARYEKPTLLVQMKVPMVIDFNEYKFYTNYFSLLPYLVNKDSQNDFAYVDFSKYKADIERVKVKEFAAYLKALNAVPYVLAGSQQIQKVNLTTAERQQKFSEKIRYSSSLEDMMLQLSMFDHVNAPYLQQTVLGQAAATEDAAEQVAANASSEHAQDAPAKELSPEEYLKQNETAEDYGMSQEGFVAYQAAVTLRNLVSQKFYETESNQEDEAADSTVVTEIASSEAYEAATQAAEEAINAAALEENILSEQDCEHLIETAKTAKVGDLTYCAYAYELKAFTESRATQAESVFEAHFNTPQEKLAELFKPYRSEQLVDAAAFAALWQKHQAEVQQIMNTTAAGKKTPIQIDVALDDQGRAAKVDYALQFERENYGTIHVRNDVQISNYGNANKIDRAALRQAKSIQEVSKDSILEKWVKNLGRSLEQDTAASEQAAITATLSYTDELKQLAEKTYQQKGAFSETYQTLFLVHMAAEQREWVKNLSPQTLQEMAEVYAYWFSDERYYDPQGAALKRIEALQAKHHLQEDVQFNNAIGRHINNLTEDAVDENKVALDWRKLKQQYKQPQQMFAQQYQKLYQAAYTWDTPDLASLKKTAQILGQTYIDHQKGKMSQSSIQSLSLEQAEMIDYEIYMDVYEDMQKYVK